MGEGEATRHSLPNSLSLPQARSPGHSQSWDHGDKSAGAGTLEGGAEREMLPLRPACPLTPASRSETRSRGVPTTQSRAEAGKVAKEEQAVARAPVPGAWMSETRHS